MNCLRGRIISTFVDAVHHSCPAFGEQNAEVQMKQFKRRIAFCCALKVIPAAQQRFDEAIRFGWTRFRLAPESQAANDRGLCPACRILIDSSH